LLELVVSFVVELIGKNSLNDFYELRDFVKDVDIYWKKAD